VTGRSGLRPREIEFRTSGHTGTPALWARTEDQLHTEALLIADSVIGEVDRVISFAPPEHVFGRLFGEVLPWLRGIPVQQLHDDALRLPDLVGQARTLFICLPASWLLLRRMTERIRTLPGTVVLHGAGPTTPTTTQVVSELAGTAFRAVELFGSTETGGVAYREITAGPPSGQPWRLLPDVELVIDGPLGGTQLLHVRSPRLARCVGTDTPPESYRLHDVVRVIDERHFEHLGRNTQLVKVNGRRCNLADIEKAVRTALDTDVACLAMRDTLRGEHYELFYDSRAGALTDDEVWRRLSDALPRDPVPRAIHAVPAIPRTMTGKVKLDQLYTGAARRPALGEPR
jgi:acyl-coenzyme A synthetase/AMP-(fatty) acid ligase